MAEWKLIAAPNGWRDLQEKVRSILMDCGYEAEVEKEINLGRGKAVVDVYAHKSAGLSVTIICECKHWQKRVPRAVVQGFRTIVTEAGANLGYIISAKGFQSGSYEVVVKTNVQLLLWDEFEVAFRMEWLRTWVDKVSRAGIELRSFVNYLISLSFQKDAIGSLIESKWSEMEDIRGAHEDWLFMSMEDHYTHFNTSEHSWEGTLNTIEEIAPRYLPLKPEYLRDYFSGIYDHCRDEIAKIESLYEGAVKWDPKTMLPY